MTKLRGTKKHNPSFGHFPPNVNDFRDELGNLVVPWVAKQYAWLLPGGKLCHSRREVTVIAKNIMRIRGLK